MAEDEASGTLEQAIEELATSDVNEQKDSDETLEQIIKEFAGRDVNKQRNSIVDNLDRVKDSTDKLELTLRIKHLISFLQSIKPQVLTRHSGMAKIYYDASFVFSIFVGYLKRNNIDKQIEKLTDDEKSDVSVKINNLLDKLIGNLSLQKARVKKIGRYAKDLENFIEEIRDSIVLIVDAIERREKEKEKEKTITTDLGTQAGLFTDKANEYRDTAKWFLRGAGIFIGVIALPTIYNLSYNLFCKIYNLFCEICTLSFCKPSSELGDVNLEQGDYLYFYVALKTLLSSSTLLSFVMLVGLFACISFYATSKHNATVCDHRASTLNSYQALRDAAGENQGERLLVLQKVLDAATDHQPTGFSKEGSGVSGVITKIASVFASILTKSAK